MAQRRFHYEQAFEQYLRANRVPYVAVDEAKKALLPAGQTPKSLKSFDFVVYAPGPPEAQDPSDDPKGTDAAAGAGNRLVDVKGRKYAGKGGRRLETWVTGGDVESMIKWSTLFGAGFEAVFVFAYWCAAQPPDALFQEVFEHGGRWYALREVPVEAYAREMVERSAGWGTVHVPAAAFDRISRPFTVRGVLGGAGGSGRGISEGKRGSGRVRAAGRESGRGSGVGPPGGVELSCGGGWPHLS